MEVSALSRKYEEIVDCIVSPVEISNPYTDDGMTTMGIWDTGATVSAITAKAAQQLGLKTVQKTQVQGVHGVRDVNVYCIKITLNNRNISVRATVTECDELSADNSVGILIGMNIITKGDFCISNYQGKTTMTFRSPSVEATDYVEEISEYNKYLKIHLQWMRKNNDKCPCGSGKKYGNCHGRSKYSDEGDGKVK